MAFPSPETLQNDLNRSAVGAIQVLKQHDFEVHGAQNFYTLDAAESLDAEAVKALIAQTIRVYVPVKASYTIEVKPAKQ